MTVALPTAELASRPDPVASPRYKAFGSFRLLLALIVLLNHTGWVAKNTGLGSFFIGARFGSAAVLMFFMLSGYIITEAATTFYAGRPLSFAQNRALKILPLFLAALALSLAVHLVALSQDRLLEAISFEGYEKLPRKMFGPVNLIFNVVSVAPFIPVDPIRALFETDIYPFVRYIWAVQIEVAFYLAVFLLMVTRLGTIILNRVNHLLLLGVLAALVLFDTFVYRITYELQFAPYFLFGALVYLGPTGVAHFRIFLSVLAVLIVLHVSAFFTDAVPFTATWLASIGKEKRLFDFALFALLVAAFLGLSRVRLDASAARLDRRLGDLSYSLYLNQYAVLVAYSALALAPRSKELAYWAVVAVAILVAALMQRFVEAPLTSIRDRVRGRSIASTTQAPAAVTISGEVPVEIK